ncbi:type II toxin-antitoxin system RnlB family antitoxin [Fusobacterium vincentii]|uniref:type II toxin-antitoxin system RnlB family antitoxin n=1 Tax=Fusobacterium vincentii TaxID=155615 RepID=UPI0030D38270
MKNDFEILKLNNELYDFLVIATSYNNPLSSFQEIVKKLKVEEAKLIFDLTLINGINKNRYVKCKYRAGKNQFQFCEIPEDISETIKVISKNYFNKHEEIIDKSVLTDSLKFLLKSNMI